MPPSHQLTCNHQVCKIQNSTIKRIINLEFWNIACRDIMFIFIHGTYYWCLIDYGNYIIGSFYYIIGVFKVISSSMLYFPDLLKLYLSCADLDQLLPHHAWLITPWWQDRWYPQITPNQCDLWRSFRSCRSPRHKSPSSGMGVLHNFAMRHA